MQMIACGACSRALLAYPGSMSIEIASIFAARSPIRGSGSLGSCGLSSGASGDPGCCGSGGSSSAKNFSAASFAGAFAAPHDLAATVVGDEREVAVLLSPGHLVGVSEEPCKRGRKDKP